MIMITCVDSQYLYTEFHTALRWKMKMIREAITPAAGPPPSPNYYCSTTHVLTING
jgi:hypothetical protein